MALAAGVAILLLGGALAAFVVTREGAPEPLPEGAVSAPRPVPAVQPPPAGAQAPAPAAAPPIPPPAPPAAPSPAAAQADAAAAVAALRPEIASSCKVTAGRFRFHLVFDASGREAARSVVGLDAEGRKAAGCLIRMAPGSLRIPAPGRRVSTVVNVALP